MTEKVNPEIPEGHYCYDIDPHSHQRRLCPHWKAKLINGYPGAHCSLLNKDGEYQSMDLIWD